MKTWITLGFIVATTALSAFSGLCEERQLDNRSACTFTKYGEGSGPIYEKETFHLLDKEGSQHQANTVGFSCDPRGVHQGVNIAFKLRVPEGAEGGFIGLLNTHDYASSGPAPYLPQLEAPNFKDSFGVGIDVSNPKNEDWFRGPGNFYGHPEREVSLHWNGREIVKRRAEQEFRGEEFVDWNISVQYVIGGAEITVQFKDYNIYDGYFIPSMKPYAFRLAIGARTGEIATTFDVKDLVLKTSDEAKPVPNPVNLNLFNYVQTTQSNGVFTSEVELPPEDWAFGRVIMKIWIHGGSKWDEWDRCAHVSVEGPDGEELKIVSFITSYKTPCYWEVDVTDFRSLLAGKTKFFIHAGTIYRDKGFLMSVDLDFHLGRPEQYAYKVIPLWRGTARYQSDDNPFGDFYDERSAEIPENTIAARLHLVHTGHSQVGEFTPAKRTLKCNDAGFENVLWRDDCYLNPNRPQFGTWKFSRAGWAPGDICYPWLIDVFSHITPGKSAVFNYIPHKYDFEGAEELPSQNEIAKASHNVSAYLILYEEPKDLIDAPTVLVLKVTPNSAAHKADLKAGDYLYSYNGVRLFSRDDVDAAKKQALAEEKETVKLVFYRGSKKTEIDFPTGQMGVNLATR